MTSIQFQPAAADGWLAIVSQNRVLVIETADDSFVREAWVAVASEDAVQPVLEILTRRGLSSTPAFAFVVLGDDSSLRVVLRGALSVTVADGSGEHVLSSAGVSTWLERIFTESSGVTISPAGATAAAIGSLPLVSGVAWVSSVTLGSTSTIAAAPAPSEVVAAAASIPPVYPVSELDAPVPALVPVAPVAEAAAAPEPVADPAPEPVAEIDIEATVTDAQLDAQAPPPPPAEASGYDYLFGDTMYRSVADAAVREPEEVDEAEVAPVAEVVEGDHDGHTVLTSDIQRVRGRRDSAAPVLAPPPPPVAATISIVQKDGARTALTHSVIIGRSPSVSKVSGEFIPALLTIGGDQDISRNHAQVSLEGGTPVVTDLHSRNGTSVVLPGRSPQKLRAGEATAVIVGTVIDLGGGVTLTLEED